MSQNISQTIEQLERRQLFAATANLVGTELQITGTEEKDAIVVSLNKDDAAVLDVKINREKFTFATDAVDTIVIDALGGNDKITIKEKHGVIYSNCVIDAGEGNDNVTTGSGNDIVEGGAGNDKMTGGAGDDNLSGSDGNDRLLGGSDDDQLDAGAGADKVVGEEGDDNLDGGEGADLIRAGEGANRVAADDANLGEVRDKDQSANSEYEVIDVTTLPAELVAIIAEANTHIPDLQFVRGEKEGENWSVYYRFGSDPAVYKIVVSIIDSNVELVNRQVSLQEARSVALAAFNTDHPNAGVLSLFQHPHGVWDVRVRNLEGKLETITTDDIVWGLDDLDQDMDNDGRDDHDGEFDNQNGGDGQNNGGGDGQNNV